MRHFLPHKLADIVASLAARAGAARAAGRLALAPAGTAPECPPSSRLKATHPK